MKKYIIIGIIAILIGIGYSSQSHTPSPTQSKSLYGQTTANQPVRVSPSPNYEKNPKNTLQASLSVLDALSSYYVASNADQTINDTSQNQLTQNITILLKQNQYLQDGNILVQQYTNDPNQIISITTKSMITGALDIIKANNDYINFLKSVDLNDPNFQQKLSYAIARHSSDQDAGFKLIVQGAPQISSLYYDYPKTKNPSGPVPYLISKEDRQTIIDKINSLFGKELQKYPKGYDALANNYIVILVAVNAIRNNIVPNTYEEIQPLTAQ